MSLSDGIAYEKEYGWTYDTPVDVAVYEVTAYDVLKQLGHIGIVDTGLIMVKSVQDIALSVLNKDYKYAGILYSNSRPGNTPEIDTWIDWLHATYHIPYTLDGAKRVWLKMSQQVLSVIGLNARSASLLSAAWAVHYGQWLHADRYGYFPVDPDKFIQDALEADDLEGMMKCS